MKKKILGMLIAVMMIGTVTGCGKTETSSTDTTEGVVYVSPPTPTPTVETVRETKEIDFAFLTEVWDWCFYGVPVDREFKPKSGDTVTLRYDGETSTAISDYEEWNKAWNENFGDGLGYVGDIIVTFGEKDGDMTVTYGDITVGIKDV